jgi:hypothetical protein
MLDMPASCVTEDDGDICHCVLRLLIYGVGDVLLVRRRAYRGGSSPYAIGLRMLAIGRMDAV